ncbi:MAG: ABC transporter substrate-binding protein [Clostridium fessum]
MVLDWYPNAIHTFIYTAIERGYYAEEGLDVKVRFPANANDASGSCRCRQGGDRNVLSAGCDPGGCKSGNEDQVHRCDRAVSVEHCTFFKG